MKYSWKSPSPSLPVLWEPDQTPASLHPPLRAVSSFLTHPPTPDTFFSASFKCTVLIVFHFFVFLATLQTMEFWGQGSNLSHSSDLHWSCGNARSFSPLHRSQGSNLCPGTSETPPIRLCHSRNSCLSYNELYPPWSPGQDVEDTLSPLHGQCRLYISWVNKWIYLLWSIFSSGKICMNHSKCSHLSMIHRFLSYVFITRPQGVT